MSPPPPDYVVVRAAPGVVLPQALDGVWLDRSDMTRVAPGDPQAVWTCEPTGRFEARDCDGAIAEVWHAYPARAP